MARCVPISNSCASDLGLRHTKFIGRVPFEAMPDLYDAADIYLNANDIDNTPASILESFASGLLVVTTEAGGIPYILEHERTGLMVKCGDHEALAASAIRLLEDPVLASRLARNARESVPFFHSAAVCEEWLSLYRELTGLKIDPGRAWFPERAMKRSLAMAIGALLKQG